MKLAALIVLALGVVVVAVGLYVIADQGEQAADDRATALCLQEAEARYPIIVTQDERPKPDPLGIAGGGTVLRSDVENIDERSAAVSDCVD